MLYKYTNFEVNTILGNRPSIFIYIQKTIIVIYTKAVNEKLYVTYGSSK